MGRAPLDWRDIAFSVTGDPDVNDATVKEILTDMYRQYSMKKIAIILGISYESVRSKMKDLGFSKPRNAGRVDDS